jgi:translocation and assembly module TamB
VSEVLSDLLDRPVQVGDVEGFTLASLRLGESSIPPTETDRDRATAAAIEVQFNLWQALLNRKLLLDITLVEPDVFIDQSADGDWLQLPEFEEQEEGFIELNQLGVRDGRIVLAPAAKRTEAELDLDNIPELPDSGDSSLLTDSTNPTDSTPAGPSAPTSARFQQQEDTPKIVIPPPVTITQVNGQVTFLNNYQDISFELAGQPEQGGSFKLQGRSDLEVNRTKLSILGEAVPAPEVLSLLPLPLVAETGRLWGNLTVEIQGTELAGVNGTARFQDVTAAILGVPSYFNQANGRLRFQGQEIALEDVRGRYGQIPATASGTIDLEKGYNLAAEARSVTAQNVLDTFELNVPVPILGTFDADLKVTGALETPKIQGTAQNVRPVRVDRIDVAQVQGQFSVTPEQLQLENVRAIPAQGGEVTGEGQIVFETEQLNFDFAGTNLSGDALARAYGLTSEQIRLGQLAAIAQVRGTFEDFETTVRWQAPEATYPGQGEVVIAGDTIRIPNTIFQVAGGTVTATGQSVQGQWQAAIAGSRVQLSEFADNINGVLNGTARLSGNLNDPSLNAIRAEAEAVVDLAAGSLNLTANAARGQWQAIAQGRGIQLSQFSPNLQGTASGNVRLSGQIEQLDANAIQANAEGVLNLDQGTANLTGNLNQGRWNATVNGSNFQLSQFSPNLQGVGSGVVNLSGTLANLSPNAIQADGRGVLNLAQGSANLNGTLNQGQWRATVDANNLPLSQFSNELRGTLTGDVRLAGTLANLSPNAIQAEGRAEFSEGIAQLDRPLDAQFRWTGDRLELARVTGPGLEASGFVAIRFADTTPNIELFDLTARLDDFDLQDLPVAIPPQVQLAGLVSFDGRVNGTPTAPNAVGQLRLNNLVVNEFNFDPVLAGDVRYVTGEGLNLDLTGENDRIFARLDAENRPIEFLIRQDELLAVGQSDGTRLTARLENFPIEVLGIAPAPEQGLDTVAGRLSGDFTADLANLSNPRVDGTVAIAQPALGFLQANQFSGEFSYSNGLAELMTSELLFGSSRYLISGEFNLANSQFQGTVEAADGKLEDVLEILQIFELADLQRFQQGQLVPAFTPRPGDEAEVEASVATVPIDVQQQTLLNQLRRFSEINELLSQQQRARQEAAILPELSELTGQFAGVIELSGGPQTGLAIDFGLEGQDWRWGEYSVEQVLASGTFADNVLTLLPVRFWSTEELATGEVLERSLTFSGVLGGAEQSGQLRAQNIPLQPIRELAQLPINLNGDLNGTATLSGSVLNPQVVGAITLNNATLNSSNVADTQVRFGYINARLNFDTRVLVARPDPGDEEPFRIAGSIPYAFQFMDTQPEAEGITLLPEIAFTEDIILDVNVQNEGLSVINVLSQQQIRWEGGNGDVNLEVRGTLQQPTASGNATFAAVTLSANLLPEPITNLTGDIQFEGDRIIANNLQGDFSDGQLVVSGTIPLLFPVELEPTPSIPLPEDVAGPVEPPSIAERVSDVCQSLQTVDTTGGISITPPDTSPLTLTLCQIALEYQTPDLQDLYDGQVNGQVVVTGTALAPELSGEVVLSDGRIHIPTNTQLGAAPALPEPDDENTFFTPPRLNDFEVALGDRLRVVQQPVMDFQIAGELTINGILNGDVNNLLPAGEIELVRGQLNLFTTRFGLASRYNNRAVFDPENGLNPYIDVRLVSSVPEVTRTPVEVSTPFAVSEIEDRPITDFGAFRTVRIQATVRGPADEVARELLTQGGIDRELNTLELTSDPRRNRSEIIGLLGGSFVDSLGQGDGTLALANLASTAILGSVQDFIINALGLSEFRLYPTSISSANDRTSSFGVAAELGINITDNLSFSALQILTDDGLPPQFNLGYRLSDELRVLGTTNLEDENRILLEFETRF